MSLSVRTNISSIDAQRNLFQTQMDLNSAVNHLSSGYRITSAADDAAGLGISEALRSQVRGANQAVRNAQDGISLIQTADGGMNQQTQILQRMRELGVEASNDTLTTNDRGNVLKELQQLQSEFNAISTRTVFNGQSLLSGSFQGVQNTAVANSVLVGSAANTATVAAIDVSNARASTYTFSNNGGKITLSDTNSVHTQVIDISAATWAANSQQTLNFDQLGVKLSFTTSASTAGTAVGAALDTLNITTTGGNFNLQLGANAVDGVNAAGYLKKVDLTGTVGDTNGFDALATSLGTFAANGGQTSTNAKAILTAVDNALTTLSGIRATLGAVQNRLSVATANLQTTSENLSASDSRIRDVNVAEETSKMTSAQVLMQAGISVLAQANQQPQLALKLLG